MGERKRRVDVQANPSRCETDMRGTTRHTRGPPHFLLYSYRDTVLLGAAKSPLFSPLTTPPSIGSQDTRLRTTAVAVGGWKMGLGTDGIVNFDSPRGGNGPRTRRRGVGGGRRGMRGPDLF
jgi:hypothetical protein